MLGLNLQKHQGEKNENRQCNNKKQYIFSADGRHYKFGI